MIINLTLQTDSREQAVFVLDHLIVEAARYGFTLSGELPPPPEEEARGRALAAEAQAQLRAPREQPWGSEPDRSQALARERAAEREARFEGREQADAHTRATVIRGSRPAPDRVRDFGGPREAS